LFRNEDRWFAKKIKVAKDETWKSDIMAQVLQAFKTNHVPAVVFPYDDHLKTFTKKRERPDKEEIVPNTKTRFVESDV